MNKDLGLLQHGDQTRVGEKGARLCTNMNSFQTLPLLHVIV